ncbi:Arm DNA-binding domain-containing protein [Bacillus sp. JCM 19041]|uniref:Arm DNA-binding domain-containing protein n=1 Tax=Bacillus sp. JCM 19041 TaxID=1460637 RepID=UPI0006CF3627
MRGSITKKGNKYFIVVDLERDHNNKRRQKWFSGYSTKKAAEKDLPRILNELYQGTYVEPSNETVESYMNNWLKNKKKQNSSFHS